MTQPATNTTPAASGQGHLGALTAAAAILLLTRHADQAVALEHRAAAAPVRLVRQAATDVSRYAAGLWVAQAGSLTAPLDPIASSAVTAQVVARIEQARPDGLADLLAPDIGRAYLLGARQAATALDEPAPHPIDVSTPSELLGQTTGLDAAVSKRWADAERMLLTAPPEHHDDLSAALAPLHAAGMDVDRDARSLVNQAVNRAAHDTAVDHDTRLIWVAERTACVVCAALSGDVVGADEDFSPHATFGDKPTEWWTPPGVTLLRPPRHPRCRCRVEPWLGHAGPPGSLSLPEALKREAQRSILRGFSVPSESETVRVRAADRLLARGTQLPKTVRAYARAAVNRGRFPTRTLPTGKDARR